jgi:alpha-L-rhamnosidase
MEWAYRDLAGIDTVGAGYKRILIRPRVPSAGSNPDQKPIDVVKAHYDSIHGRIASAWQRQKGTFVLDVTIPPNTTARVVLPDATAERTTESGSVIAAAQGIRSVAPAGADLAVEVSAGRYHFEVRGGAN